MVLRAGLRFRLHQFLAIAYLLLVMTSFKKRTYMNELQIKPILEKANKGKELFVKKKHADDATLLVRGMLFFSVKSNLFAFMLHHANTSVYCIVP